MRAETVRRDFYFVAIGIAVERIFCNTRRLQPLFGKFLLKSTLYAFIQSHPLNLCQRVNSKAIDRQV